MCSRMTVSANSLLIFTHASLANGITEGKGCMMEAKVRLSSTSDMTVARCILRVDHRSNRCMVAMVKVLRGLVLVSISITLNMGTISALNMTMTLCITLTMGDPHTLTRNAWA